MPDYRHLLVERSDDRHVVTVTLNRPEQHNAMNTAMGEDLLGCFTALTSDADARVVILTGGGDRAFCAGGDLKERNGMTDEAWASQHRLFEAMIRAQLSVPVPIIAAVHGAAMRLLRCPVPVIAAVEGFARAGGCELAILSDFIVAGDTAVFGVPETTLGIFPGIGGTQLLPRIVGAPLAKELIFTGRRMKADEARAVGLVNHLVPAGQARAKAREIAETIARNGPIAVRQAKKAIAYGSETDLETAMILAIEAYNATVVTEDRLEGVRAFNEKRRPQYKGR
jgi:enoyl-CoA hydratase